MSRASAYLERGPHHNASRYNISVIMVRPNRALVRLGEKTFQQVRGLS